MVQPVSQSSDVTSASAVTVRVAWRSDPGLDPDKQVNEDSCIYSELPIGHLMLVCDGMGGHVGGKQASEAAVQTIVADLQKADLPGEQGANEPGHMSPGLVLKNAIEHAGQVVFELGGDSKAAFRPGSTVVAVLTHRLGSDVAHVGDSRGYLMRAGTIHPITRDHSMVQQMVDAGVLSPAEALNHPDANKITRALGMHSTVRVELRSEPIAHQPGDVFLLCSDGLTDLVEPHEMLAAVTQAQQTSHPSQSLDLACQQLIALANSRGGHDNITVLLGEVLQCPPCVQTQTKTIVDDPIDGQGPDGGAGRTLVMNDPNAPMLQATIIDAASLEGPSVGVAMTVPSWSQNASSSTVLASNRNTLHDGVKYRGTTWLIVGIALMLVGVGIIAVCVWWVYGVSESVDLLQNKHYASVLFDNGFNGICVDGVCRTDRLGLRGEPWRTGVRA